jgi:O-antigen/teichoic acid export membrane protein
MSYAVGSVAGFATQSVLGRTFGTSTYGVYVTGLAIATTLSVVQEVAGPAWLVRIAAQDGARYSQLAGAVLVFRIVAGAGVVVAGTGVAAALGVGWQGIVVTAVLAIVAGLNAVLRSLRAGFQAAERMPTSAALATLNSVVTAVLMIALMFAGAGLVAAVAASAVVSLLLVPLVWRLLDVPLRPRPQLRLRPLGAVAVESMPFTVVAALAVVLAYADTLVIRALLGNHATGLYGAAWRLLTVLQWVPSIVLDSVLRGMAALAVDDRRRFRDLVDRAAAGLLVVALPVAVAGSFLAHPVFVFVFGPDFGAGADAFRILLWSLPLSYPAWIVTEAVLVGGRPASLGWLLSGAVAGNVVANVIAVPRYGIEGSAWITLGTELVVLAGAMVLLRRHGTAPRWPLALVPAAALSGITAAAVIPLASQPLAVPLVTGTAAYLMGGTLLWRLSRSTRWAARLLLARDGPAQ